MNVQSLESLKAAFAKNDNQNRSRPNNYFPFWLMKVGESATVRFLPDNNPENPLGFMVEKTMHNLVINGERKNVPCLKMYGDDCPICKVASDFYKQDDKANGKKYYKKRQHLAQALIVSDPLPANEETGEKHEGKVRFLALGYQLFNVIKEAFESGELETVPYAFENGCDFIIKKTQQGEYATYAVGSRFARKESDLTEDQVAYVTDHVVELDTLLPGHPGAERVESMLEAAMTGKVMSEESSDAPFEAGRAAVVEAAASTTTDTSDGDFDEEAEAILADIRKRRKPSSK